MQTITILTKGKQAPSFRHRLTPLIAELVTMGYQCHIEELKTSRYVWRIWKNRAIYKDSCAIILHKLLLPKIEVSLLANYSDLMILDIDDAIYLREPKWEDVRLEKLIWSEEEKRFLATADIGIMPLDDSEYSRGKCAFKLLQYMAAKLPCVASPVGVNTEVIIDEKNGYLANTEDQWLEKLSLLIEAPKKRVEMGNEGLAIARSNYSQKTIAQRYANFIIEKINENHKN